MRFFENGPTIPDLLLERRDAGRVVFFCGAGVSLNAGMPTFLGLTKYVVDFFDPPEDSDIMEAFGARPNSNAGATPHSDQVFSLLQREYGREEVNNLVTERLASSAVTSAASAEHSIISRISTDQHGNPQIVTTNFDLLFEQAVTEYSCPINVPPSLPDLSLGMPITGITHLHGKLAEETGHHHPYILSSADFGRAYLAEGWATNFVRSLLSKYIVVFVGYQAQDPPIQYLLEGLNHDGGSDLSNLYAFDKGRSENIETNWRDRGVTPIAYSDHPVLWKTMEAWAERADDPRQWRRNVIGLTRNDPKTLKPYQRGQVAHMIRTTPGAKQFRKAEPAPHPEWVCVFDAGTRAAEPSNGGYGEEAETFVPLDAYGLDDDPPRSQKGGRQSQVIYKNLLEWNKGDENPSSSHRIGGRQVEGFDNIPSRLLHLTAWIGSNLDSPVMAWWVARQFSLHPRLINTLKRGLLSERTLHANARQTWNLILEHQTDRRRLVWEDGLFDLRDRIDREGWTQSFLRDFAETTRPKIECSIPMGIGRSRPPSGTWDNVKLPQITHVKIDFPDPFIAKIDVPDNMLEQVVMLLQTNLRQASGILSELSGMLPTPGVWLFRTPTCYPDREVEGNESDLDFDADIRRFVRLFKRLAVYDPKSAAAIASTWPQGDSYFFRNLKLFALNHGALFDIDQTFASIQSFDDNAFWNYNSCRELLFLLADRWAEFTDSQQLEIASRILAGPPKPEYLGGEEYPEFRDKFAARYGRFLTLQECVLPSEASDRLDTIIASLSKWSDGWATDIVTAYYGKSGRVKTNNNPEVLLDQPVNEIVRRAKEHSQRDSDSFTDKRPFTGLVKINSRKALSALTIASKHDDYPTELWAALIQEWPKDAPDRLFRVFMQRLAGLPQMTVRELRYTLADWLWNELPALLARDKKLAWRVFDHCISAWISDKEASTESWLREISIGNELINKSRRTLHHAINGPVGQVTGGIIRSINESKLKKAESIPDEFKSRLERLLDAPGEGSDHCVAVLTRDLCWLHYIDPDWAVKRLLPLFAFDHHAAEPAWNGLLNSGEVPSLDILIALKELLTDLFPRIYEYGWERDVVQAGAQWLAWMALFRCDELGGLSAKEARACLRKMNDDTRQSVIFGLGLVGKKNVDGWKRLVIPFLKTVWPREKSFRTSASVTSWISMLEYTGDNFPAVYKAAKKFLVPIEGQSHWLYRFTTNVDGETCLASRYPAQILDLTDTVTPTATDAPPNGLSQLLELIENADSKLVGDPKYNRLLDLVERV